MVCSQLFCNSSWRLMFWWVWLHSLMWLLRSEDSFNHRNVLITSHSSLKALRVYFVFNINCDLFHLNQEFWLWRCNQLAVLLPFHHCVFAFCVSFEDSLSAGTVPPAHSYSGLGYSDKRIAVGGWPGQCTHTQAHTDTSGPNERIAESRVEGWLGQCIHADTWGLNKRWKK